MCKRILILGGSGLLGLNLSYDLKDKHDVILGLNSRMIEVPGATGVKLPFRTLVKLTEAIEKIDPDIIVNCVALTSVDECEKNFSRGKASIVETAKNFAQISNLLGKVFVHFSTDQIYDGDFEGLYSESNATTPINKYGKLKLEAERQVLLEQWESIIIRTNFFCLGSSYRQSLTDIILQSLENKIIFKGFTDVFFTPVHTSKISEVIDEIDSLDKGQIYNIANDTKISKYDFSLKICENFGYDKKLIYKYTSDEANFYAARPKNMGLSNNKLKLRMPKLDLSLKGSIEALKKQIENASYEKSRTK